MKEDIILDSGSSTSLFCKEEFCNKIASISPIEIKTNVGSIFLNQKYKAPDLGPAYYDNNSLTNIIGLRDMRNKYCITYNSQKEPSFLIYTEKGIVKFKENEDDIYAIDIRDKKGI